MTVSFRDLVARARKKFPQVSSLPRLFSLVWVSTRGWTIAWAFLLLLSGLLPAATIWLTKALVNDMVGAVKAGGSWASVRPLVVTGILFGSLTIATEIVLGLLEWIRTILTELIQDHVSALIQTKSTEVDYGFYESTDYYDQLHRARDSAQVRILSLLENLGSVCQSVITLALLTAIVASYHLSLFAIMLLSVLPAFYVVARFNWLTHQWWMSTTIERRWIQYYDDKFSNLAGAAEIRLFRLGPRFQSAYREIRRVLRESRLALIKRQNIARIGGSLVGMAVAGGAVGWIGWKVLLGKASFGDMALFFQAFMSGQGYMRMLTQSLAQAYSNSLFVTNLFDFLDLQPTIIDPAQPMPPPSAVQYGIGFHNVAFRYPGSDRPVFENLSLFIPAGKITAIVGPNGAGKSTLIKLLSRFYDPVEGHITIDDVCLADLKIEDVRSMLAVLFQLPVSYDASAAENIAIGDFSAEGSLAKIQEAARSAGAHEVISRLPRGYQQQLGKSFTDGAELSAGEWQRIAMARAFFRKTPILLLDEPTSFMDSWAEVEWFGKLRNLSRGRTAMIITHRFTIAMRADIIHVMDEGRLVESGTHEELLDKDGLYSKSWRDQMSASSTPVAAGL